MTYTFKGFRKSLYHPAQDPHAVLIEERLHEDQRRERHRTQERAEQDDVAERGPVPRVADTGGDRLQVWLLLLLVGDAGQRLGRCARDQSSLGDPDHALSGHRRGLRRTQ